MSFTVNERWPVKAQSDGNHWLTALSYRGPAHGTCMADWWMLHRVA